VPSIIVMSRVHDSGDLGPGDDTALAVTAALFPQRDRFLSLAKDAVEFDNAPAQITDGLTPVE
jgi:hypothetical protein